MGAGTIIIMNFIVTYALAICHAVKNNEGYFKYPNNCEPSSSMVRSIPGARPVASFIGFFTTALNIWGLILQKHRAQRRLKVEFKESWRPFVVCCVGAMGALLLLSCVYVCKETS